MNTKLFDDGSECAVAISRPGHRLLKWDQAEKSLAKHIATTKATPLPTLCFDRQCKNEIRSFGVCLFVTLNKTAPPQMMAFCPECAKKSNGEILAVIRQEMKDLGFNKLSNTNNGAYMPEMTGVSSTVCGIRIFVDGVQPCRVKEIFVELLEGKKLPWFISFHGAHSNCHNIVRMLYSDFKALGIENEFTYKTGFSGVPTNGGKPIGLHSWIECDGWVVDGSGGALGSPVLFQRVQDFYAVRQMTDIQERRLGAELILAEQRNAA